MSDHPSAVELPPYPLRDMVEETRRLVVHEPDYLPRINHFLFRGLCGFTAEQRVLVVGGTGDAAVFLAEQLRDRGAELHYAEPDTARRTQTLGRLVARDLMGRVVLHAADPATLTPDQIGSFDYISVSEGLIGVQDPSAILLNLSKLLNRTGGMCITLPGKYGRIGTDMLRQCLTGLRKSSADRGRLESFAQTLVPSLSGLHPFMAGRAPLDVVEHWRSNHAELVHDILDSNDRSWSVPELFALTDQADLHLTDFTFTDLRDPNYTAYYRPHFFARDPDLLAAMAELPIRDLYAMAELLHGRMTRHTFYASRMAESSASPLRLDNVPFLWPERGWRVDGDKVVMRDALGSEIAAEISMIGRTLFEAINGQRTIAELCQEVRDALPWRTISDDDLGDELVQLYGNFGIWGGLMFRHSSVAPFTNFDEQFYR